VDDLAEPAVHGRGSVIGLVFPRLRHFLAVRSAPEGRESASVQFPLKAAFRVDRT